MCVGGADTVVAAFDLALMSRRQIRGCIVKQQRGFQIKIKFKSGGQECPPHATLFDEVTNWLFGWVSNSFLFLFLY